ncbi:MAG: DUF523 domain-containing protein [Clostridia bacterium]|nr:DUF523 domain-containing protein [Clostridia bacterium]
MKILISACLMGVRCRYDGRAKPLPEDLLSRLMEKHTLIPACPEQLGGLPTPRADTQRVGDEILGIDGESFTKEYYAGAQEALRLAKLLGVDAAILADRSPSCGSRWIHDGTFSGVVVSGEGFAAQLLRENGIKVFDETEAEEKLL